MGAFFQKLNRQSRQTGAEGPRGFDDDEPLKFYDANGVKRVHIGKQDDGTYGIRTFNNAGVMVNNFTTSA